MQQLSRGHCGEVADEQERFFHFEQKSCVLGFVIQVQQSGGLAISIVRFYVCSTSKAGFSSAIDSDFKRPLWGQPQMRTRRNGASRTGSVLGAHICFFQIKVLLISSTGAVPPKCTQFYYLLQLWCPICFFLLHCTRAVFLHSAAVALTCMSICI